MSEVCIQVGSSTFTDLVLLDDPWCATTATVRSTEDSRVVSGASSVVVAAAALTGRDRLAPAGFVV